MKSLLVTPCCCREQPPEACWRAWLECPEYLKITLPGVSLHREVIGCEAVPQTHFWWLENHPSQYFYGDTPFADGEGLVYELFLARATNVVFRKQICYFSGGEFAGQPSFVLYRPVPRAQQTGLLHLDTNNRYARMFSGWQQGGTMPKVYAQSFGSTAIPLNGQHQGSFGEVEGDLLDQTYCSFFGGSYLMVKPPKTQSPLPNPACEIELQIEVRGVGYGAGYGIIPAETFSSTNLASQGCPSQTTGYQFDLGGWVHYRETWEPIDLRDFFSCPDELRSHNLPSEAEYRDPEIPASGTVLTYTGCDSYEPCTASGSCLPTGIGCFTKTENTGMGKASIQGSNSP